MVHQDLEGLKDNTACLEETATMVMMAHEETPVHTDEREISAFLDAQDPRVMQELTADPETAEHLVLKEQTEDLATTALYQG